MLTCYHIPFPWREFKAGRESRSFRGIFLQSCQSLQTSFDSTGWLAHAGILGKVSWGVSPIALFAQLILGHHFLDCSVPTMSCSCFVFSGVRHLSKDYFGHRQRKSIQKANQNSRSVKVRLKTHSSCVSNIKLPLRTARDITNT
jgi:hypothetical protein